MRPSFRFSQHMGSLKLCCSVDLTSRSLQKYQYHVKISLCVHTSHNDIVSSQGLASTNASGRAWLDICMCNFLMNGFVAQRVQESKAGKVGCWHNSIGLLNSVHRYQFKFWSYLVGENLLVSISIHMSIWCILHDTYTHHGTYFHDTYIDHGIYFHDTYIDHGSDNILPYTYSNHKTEQRRLKDINSSTSRHQPQLHFLESQCAELHDRIQRQDHEKVVPVLVVASLVRPLPPRSNRWG